MSDSRPEVVRVGTEVRWSWGNGHAQGTVREIHRESITRSSKGERITRNGSAEDPAYVIEQDDGTVVLKLRSETERA